MVTLAQWVAVVNVAAVAVVAVAAVAAVAVTVVAGDGAVAVVAAGPSAADADVVVDSATRLRRRRGGLPAVSPLLLLTCCASPLRAAFVLSSCWNPVRHSDLTRCPLQPLRPLTFISPSPDGAGSLLVVVHGFAVVVVGRCAYEQRAPLAWIGHLKTIKTIKA